MSFIMYFTLQVLKMYAWEPSFIKKVFNIREEELKCVRSMAWLNGMVGIMWFSTPYMVCGLRMSFNVLETEFVDYA